MPLRITGRHLEIKESHHKLIERKIQRLRRKFSRIDELHFTLAQEKHDCTVEISFRSGTLHAVVKASDVSIQTAIDRALEKLEQRVIRVKDKRFGNKMHVGRVEDALEEDENPDEEPDFPLETLEESG